MFFSKRGFQFDEYSLKKRAETLIQLQQINHSYRLELPNLIEEPNKESFNDRIIRNEIRVAEDPLIAFAKYIKPGQPTVAEFLLDAEYMFNYIVDEMNLSEEYKNEIYNEAFFYPLVLNISDKIIKETAKSFSKNLPLRMSFLKGKINYELVVLGIIMQYAIDNCDDMLKISVDNIRRKRGYI